MLTITDSAGNRVKELLEGKSEKGLRVYIQGGGCSGFQYGFQLELEPEEDDFVIQDAGIDCYVDSLSAQYLDGAEIDFKTDLMGMRFIVTNPNATTTCGCGSSFAV